MTHRYPRSPLGSDNRTGDDPLALLVRTAAPRAFSTGFRDRVLAGVGARREATLGSALERQFIRIVPIAAAVTLLLAGYNWWGGRQTSASSLDAALNLPGVTLAAAYTPAQLFGATIASTVSP
ncbi:MAG: hypothetical protein ABI205_07715 [Gemmatimonadaceae bacterium]